MLKSLISIQGNLAWPSPWVGYSLNTEWTVISHPGCTHSVMQCSLVRCNASQHKRPRSWLYYGYKQTDKFHFKYKRNFPFGFDWNKCTKHQFIYLLTATFEDLHIENSKNYKRWYCLHHTDCVSMCCWIISPFVIFAVFHVQMLKCCR